MKTSKVQGQAQAYLQHSSGKDQSQGPDFTQVYTQGEEMSVKFLTVLSHMALFRIFFSQSDPRLQQRQITSGLRQSSSER